MACGETKMTRHFPFSLQFLCCLSSPTLLVGVLSYIFHFPMSQKACRIFAASFLLFVKEILMILMKLEHLDTSPLLLRHVQNEKWINVSFLGKIPPSRCSFSAVFHFSVHWRAAMNETAEMMFVFAQENTSNRRLSPVRCLLIMKNDGFLRKRENIKKKS